MNFSRVSSLRVDSIRSIPATVSLRRHPACGLNLPVKAVNRAIPQTRFIRDSNLREFGLNLLVAVILVSLLVFGSNLRVGSNRREYGRSRRGKVDSRPM
jgi:hypothetical protein